MSASARAAPDHGWREELFRARDGEKAARQKVKRLEGQIERLRATQALTLRGIENRAAARAMREQMDSSKVVAYDVTPASAEDVRSLAVRLNQRLGELYEDPAKRSWFKLYKRIDEDASGRIQYTEFVAMARDQLQLSSRVLPEPTLKEVWRALDEDSSGFLTVRRLPCPSPSPACTLSPPAHARRRESLGGSCVKGR